MEWALVSQIEDILYNFNAHEAAVVNGIYFVNYTAPRSPSSFLHIGRSLPKLACCL